MRWAADENFNNDIIRGLLRRKPDVDIVVSKMLVCPARMIRLCLSGRLTKGEYCSRMTFRPSRDMPMNGLNLASRCLASLKSVVAFRWAWSLKTSFC